MVWKEFSSRVAKKTGHLHRLHRAIRGRTDRRIRVGIGLSVFFPSHPKRDSSAATPGTTHPRSSLLSSDGRAQETAFRIPRWKLLGRRSFRKCPPPPRSQAFTTPLPGSPASACRARTSAPSCRLGRHRLSLHHHHFRTGSRFVSERRTPSRLRSHHLGPSFHARRAADPA